ncbi:hypothetical protein I3842_15G169300 [Carya illinoinensis]|uniref:Vesicle transport protein n=1 Tax=Carya illinoinensis TaxID=32201 RepID=A0A922DC43_CARIL|nr:hypothetical protein I3842_15G169300 [Carya illinoinensis]
MLRCRFDLYTLESRAMSTTLQNWAFLSKKVEKSMLVFFNPIKFGLTFTLGNLLSIGSTGFLIGPKRQVAMMLDPVRIYATAIYLASSQQIVDTSGNYFRVWCTNMV